MPATSKLLAVCVVIVSMITNRELILRSAGFQDGLAGHVALNLHTVQLVAEGILEELPSILALSAPGVAAIVTTIDPAMATARVLQGTSVVPARVQVRVLHPANRDLVLPVMRGVREVPATADGNTFAVIIVGVIAHGPLVIRFASFAELLGSDPSSDLRLLHVIAVEREVDT